MMKPRLRFVSLGDTITMLPTEGRGIACKLGAVPELAEVRAESLFRLPSHSLQPGHLAQQAERIEAAFSPGIGPAMLRWVLPSFV